MLALILAAIAILIIFGQTDLAKQVFGKLIYVIVVGGVVLAVLMVAAQFVGQHIVAVTLLVLGLAVPVALFKFATDRNSLAKRRKPKKPTSRKLRIDR